MCHGIFFYDLPFRSESLQLIYLCPGIIMILLLLFSKTITSLNQNAGMFVVTLYLVSRHPPAWLFIIAYRRCSLQATGSW